MNNQPARVINNYMSKFIIQKGYILNAKLTSNQSAVKFPDKFQYSK